MKVAVINEGSTKHRNADLIRTLKPFGHTVVNAGMKNMEGEPDLNYLETGLLTALLLNLEAVDFVVGGCGTGQGYMNAVLQFPGTACGLIADPVDAFLFAQVNAGNCISLSLNKGYGGIGGDLNLELIFRTLFETPFGGGYPPHRRDIQIAARQKLAGLSGAAHLSCGEILQKMDRATVQHALQFPGIPELIEESRPAASAAVELKQTALSLCRC